MEEQLELTPLDSENVRPWLRFWARTFDLQLHTLFIVIIWTIIHVESIDAIDNTTFSILISFLYIFIEWFYMSLFGTTLGKLILGIQIITKDGTRLSKEVSLKRARLVWFRGMGIGAGLIQLIANIVGYSNLKKDRITSWDRDLGLVVKHKEIGLLRTIICPFVVILLTSVALVSLFIS